MTGQDEGIKRSRKITNSQKCRKPAGRHRAANESQFHVDKKTGEEKQEEGDILDSRDPGEKKKWNLGKNP